MCCTVLSGLKSYSALADQKNNHPVSKEEKLMFQELMPLLAHRIVVLAATRTGPDLIRRGRSSDLNLYGIANIGSARPLRDLTP